jgi:hypothetical protein
MTRDDIIRLAREAGLWMTSDERIAAVERFAALVAAEKEQQMIREGWRQCAEGQSTTQFCGFLEAAVAAERDALRNALLYAIDHQGFYLKKHIKVVDAAIDAARSKT